MENVTFLNPEFFWLFLVIPFLSFWLFYIRKKQGTILKISSLSGFKANSGWLPKVKPYLFIFRLLALSCLIVALARPQTVNMSNQTKTTKGVDIVMAIDVSGSMLAKDLKPNRMEALKEVAANFVDNRPNDRDRKSVV